MQGAQEARVGWAVWGEQGGRYWQGQGLREERGLSGGHC